MTRTKKIVYDSQNYLKTPKVTALYGSGTEKIKKTKTVVRDNPRKTVTKTTNYGPIDYYNKQTKTKTKVVKRK